jgi:hypothetical protein
MPGPDVFVSTAGRRIDIHLPPAPWPELQKAKDEYERLRGERKATEKRLGGLRGKRHHAEQADRLALAQALKDGTKEPSEDKIEKIDKEVLACNRRLEALEIALDNAEVELIEVLDLHRDEWLEEVSANVDEAYGKYAEAVEALVGASDAISYQWALFRWVRFFPETEMSFRTRGGVVAGLKAPNGDPYFAHEVLAALRQDAQRPESTRLEVVLGNE